MVSSKGVAPDETKTSVVREWPTPQSKSELQSFLGLAGYYRRFVKDYATLTQPLQCLLHKNCPWQWTETCSTVFENLKKCLTSAPILSFPRFSEGAGEFLLDVDASDVAAGAVLSQMQDGEERVLAY